jgi:hypothetical protein
MENPSKVGKDCSTAHSAVAAHVENHHVGVCVMLVTL